MKTLQIPPGLITTYKAQGILVKAGWIALLVSLFWSPATWVVSAVVIILCALYLALILFGKSFDRPDDRFSVRDFFSLPGVLSMLRQTRAAFVAWTHILVFDLFVGLFIVLDSQSQNISPWIVIPVLFAVLMFGPAGLLVYVLLRLAVSGQFDTLNLG